MPRGVYPRKTPSAEQIASRFWAKVDTGSPDACWNWRASVHGPGYGTVWHAGTIRLAHRVAWELTFGSIPDDESYHGVCVCHKCDNRRCCNPAHLFLGSNDDNMKDMARKGRSRKKLSEEDVRKIRQLLRAGFRQTDIAAQVGVSQSIVSLVNTGKLHVCAGL